MNIKEATDYLNYNIKVGIWSPEQFEGMSEDELVNFVEYELTRADDRANDNEKS